MASANIDGLTIAYDLIGDSGRPWVITPGGRFSKDDPGLSELAAALAERGNRVLLWDRPNTGASDVCFTGDSESQMQADVLAGLIRHLDLGPTVIAGGSGGARVSMLAAARHRDVTAALAVWWISGGVYGLLQLGAYYCAPSARAAWDDGMAAVAALPQWAEAIERNPANRQRILDQDVPAFVESMQRWMLAYCPCEDEVVPGLSAADARAFDVPTLVFRSGASDLNHPRATSERVAEVLPAARLVEPPWGDQEWRERQTARNRGEAGGLFVRWPLLVPQLQDWADGVLA
ncbi:alpha/beta fold hydrolase [Trujillonella endophytica]|uniref:Pimeloyl-ACP methyl ester carboxylesterase n=1 Tax=Trujillonella endophytica TaxID=673521 RepID=A0A1H8V5Z3_9ACTN|nr:alpha/beta hydrolase [Trujillella endophytica]SEP10836.1 Pimeloyl-ACP methyl ester carboxylesterase [Trujillella endophytica]